MKALNQKQEQFCQEYLVDLNATQAAIRAGYSKRTAATIGYENMRKPEITERIAEIQASALDTNEITIDLIAAGMLHEALTAKSDGARAQNWKHLAQWRGMLLADAGADPAARSDTELIAAARSLGTAEGDAIARPASRRPLQSWE